jgi:hypothetical protein
MTDHQQRRDGTEQKLRVYWDREGNTLGVWFDDPKKEHVCEESDDDVGAPQRKQGPELMRLSHLTS